MADNRYSAQEKAAIITWQLARGQAISSGEIQRRFNITPQGVNYIMDNLSRVTPIYQDGATWRPLNVNTTT